MPSIVREFLETASFQTNYLYFVATYGTTPGAIGAMANKAIRGRKIDACYSVRMADKYEKRYHTYLKNPDIRKHDMQHEEMFCWPQ